MGVCESFRWPESGTRWAVAIAMALGIGAGGLPGDVQARTIVLRASGPSAAQFRPGQVLREPLRLDLKQSDQLTLIDDQGTRELRGPAKIDDTAPRRPTQMRPIKWADLVGSRMRPQTGGIRGMKKAEEKAAPDRPVTSQDRLWAVDAASGGHWCVADFADLALWRANPAAPGEVAITSGTAMAKAAWAQGQSETAWPPAVAPRDGGTYAMRQGTRPAAAITLHRIVIAPTTASLASVLADKGCLQQLSILLDS